MQHTGVKDRLMTAPYNYRTPYEDTSLAECSGFRQNWHRWKALAERYKKSIGQNPAVRDI